MQPDDARARHRVGVVPEVELDGSVTLYGIEDWTQLSDTPVLMIRPSPCRPELTGQPSESDTP